LSCGGVPEDARFAKFLNKLIEQDDEHIRNAESRGHSFVPEMKPFLEELSLHYHNPKQCIEAINSLMRDIETEYQRLLSTIPANQPSSDYSAMAHALRKAEVTLPETIRDIFSRAQEKDLRRQRAFFASQGTGGGAFIGKIPPGRILGTLYNKLKRNGLI